MEEPIPSPAAWESTSEEETEPKEQKPQPKTKSDPMLPFRNGLRIFKFLGLPLKLGEPGGEITDENRALKCLGVNLGTVHRYRLRNPGFLGM